MTNNRRQRAERAEQVRLERERVAKAESRRRLVISAGAIAAVIALVAVAAFFLGSGADEDEGPLVVPTALTEDGGVVYDQQAAIGKSAGEATPVDVVLFVDFQCPVCKVFEDKAGAFLDQQVESGAISIEYRPQSFLDRASSTDYSSRALGAAMCVNEEKGARAYKEFSDLLFANQPKEGSEGLPDSRLVTYAEQAGAPEATSCITARTYQPWARGTGDTMGDNEDAGGERVNSTPTVWVDGLVVNGPERDGTPTMARVEDLQRALAAARS